MGCCSEGACTVVHEYSWFSTNIPCNQMEAAHLKEYVLHESSWYSTKIICIRWRKLTWRSLYYKSLANVLQIFSVTDGSSWSEENQLVIFNILCIRWRQLIWTSRYCERSASSSKRWISPLEPLQWDALRYSVPYIAKKFLCVPRKGIARPRSQFPHSSVCEPSIYSHIGPPISPQQNRQTNRGYIHVYTLDW